MRGDGPHPSEITANARHVLDRCRKAAVRAGRRPEEVTLVAAAKTQPIECAAAVLDAGVTAIGENRVQEAEAKWAGTERERVTLHLIGRLQRNKARAAVGLFDLIHSCDSLRLAERLSSLAGAEAVPVLLEVNIADEPTKAGFSPAALREAMPALAALPGLRLDGLMAIPPPAPATGYDREVTPRGCLEGGLSGTGAGTRRYHAALRALSEEMRAAYPLGPALSMGMTDDFEDAIEEGATIVRVGRAIYGERLPL